MSESGTTRVTINDVTVEISRESLGLFVEDVHGILSMRETFCKKLKDELEITLASLYSQAVNKFLFHDSEIVDEYCHFYPNQCQSHSANPDQTHTQLESKRPSGTLPVLVSYVSTKFLPVDETCAYSIGVMSTRNDFIVMLGMPCQIDYSSFQTRLEVHVGVDKKLAPICICEAGTRELERFACVLKGCVHSLIQKPIITEHPYLFPYKQWQTGVPKELSVKYEPSCWIYECPPCRVFRFEDYVYKVYDSAENQTPNFDLIKAVGHLPEATLESLSSDDRFQCLRYAWREGDHQPRSVRQFKCILKQLDKIHESGFVHGDVRIMNLIFSKTTDEAWIIDFDFVGKVGTRYPSNYNGDSDKIPERHCEARADKRKEIEHDLYSLAIIMEYYYGHIMSYRLRRKIKEVKNVADLSKIADEI